MFSSTLVLSRFNMMFAKCVWPEQTVRELWKACSAAVGQKQRFNEPVETLASGRWTVHSCPVCGFSCPYCFFVSRFVGTIFLNDKKNRYLAWYRTCALFLALWPSSSEPSVAPHGQNKRKIQAKGKLRQ